MRPSDSKYRIIDKIDAGGMAEIYRAEAELIQGLKKKVAIKRILPHLTKNKKFVSMFLDEAKLSLYLDHANIVHVFDIGRSGSTYFIVMEYIEGVNLRSLNESMQRQGQPIEIEETVFMMMEVCKGLGYAHDMVNPEDGRSLNIVHRDVSPPNILLSKNGEIKLVDFGLAKAASQVEDTEPGVVKGKFSYLSPEAARAESLDARADIFAVGIILFELLTGRRLFMGETDYQTVELIRKAQIPSMRALNPEVPPELEQIVRRALALNREDRFQHAYELQDTLARFLFSRGTKVTSRDIAELVSQCVSEREQTRPRSDRTRGVINQLIIEEVTKFTSLDVNDVTDFPDDMHSNAGEGHSALDPMDFVDPRDWTTELPIAEPDPKAHHRELSHSPEVTSLEKVLEGEVLPKSPPQQLTQQNSTSSTKSVKVILVTALVLIILAATTVFVLHTFGLLSSEEPQKTQTQ